MHDGAVVIDTRLNNKTLERDYAKAVKKLESLEDELDEEKGKRSAISMQLEEASAKADQARARVQELKKELRGIDTAMSQEEAWRNPDAAIEATIRKPVAEAELVEAERALAPLEKAADKIAQKYHESEMSVERVSKKLDDQRQKCGRMAEKTEEAAAAQDSLSDATDGTTGRMEKLLTRIKSLVASTLVFSLITKGLMLMRDWLGEVVTKNDQTAAAIARLKGALLTLAQPLLQVVIPVFTALVNLLTAVIGKIAAFLSMLGGKTVEQSAEAAGALNDQADAYGGVADAAKKAQKQLMGFDEINKLETTETTSGGGGGGGTSGEIAPDFSWTEGVSETMEKIAKWVLLIAAGLALWKIGTMLPGTLGTILTVIGKLAAGIGLVVTGFILLSEGFEDAAENGFTLENVLTIIAGIIATGLGISILTGSLIPLLVAGILSVLLAIVNLTGNGGELLEGLKQIFNGLITFVTGVFAGDWGNAWSGIVEVGKGAVNVLVSIVNSLIELAVAALNWLSFDLPDWMGGGHFGFNIQNAPQIPYLAEGTVIPPNRKFLAVLGDQTHGTNIEAPLDTIKQAVAEVLAGQGGGETAELLRELIATVQSIEVGDDVIGKAAARYSRKTARARGT